MHGIKSLDIDSAQALSAWRGYGLEMNGLSTINPEVAQALASIESDAPWMSYILLEGLQELEEESARGLSQYKGGKLFLNGIKKATPEMMHGLKDYKRTVILNGVQELDIETAKAFSKTDIEFIWFNGLQELELETARALSSWNGNLKLNGLHN